MKKKTVRTVLQDTESLKHQFKFQEEEKAKRLVGSRLFPEYILFLLIKINSS